MLDTTCTASSKKSRASVLSSVLASVLAIISRAQFEADFGKARVGDVLPIGEYKSAHKALDRFDDGGALLS